MSSIFITLDYEIFFGSDSGSQENSIIYPTQKIFEILEREGVKASFFIDSGYLIKLDEYRKIYPLLEERYQEIVSQIKMLDSRGHDIQLHIHPHWEDSYFDGIRWVIDTKRYRLHEFNNKQIERIVYRYKKVLTDIVGDKIFAHRAGGWCIQPFDRLSDALKKHNIWLDSTLYENGRNRSATHYFDFRNIPKKSRWSFDDDPCQEEKDGFFTEIPISSYGLSPLFFWRLAYYKKFGGARHNNFGDGTSAGGSNWDKLRMLTRFTKSVVSIDGYKASFLEKSYKKFLKKKDSRNFIIIGHPKSTSPYSLEKLEEFIQKNSHENFTTYTTEFQNKKQEYK